MSRVTPSTETHPCRCSKRPTLGVHSHRRQNVRRIIPLLFTLVILVPAATAFADGGYQTPNGIQTVSSMSSQLRSAGYGGPWDDASVVAAYAQTTGGSVTAVSNSGGGAVSTSTAPGRTIVIQIGGYDSRIDTPDWDLLDRQLRSSFGYQQSDVFTYSYRGWHVDDGSLTMMIEPYDDTDTCDSINNQINNDLAPMLRYIRDHHWADHVVLVGHSLGGVMAFDGAATLNDLTVGPTPFIRGVVTIDAPLQGITGLTNFLGQLNSLGCGALSELRDRSTRNSLWQPWLVSSAQSLIARNVRLMLAENQADSAVLEFQQGIPGVAANYAFNVADGSFGDHSALLFDEDATMRIANWIGRQT